ncbi:MAG: hypothetical protein ACRD96_16940, partial [Bryobacteraceae bacterium]
MVAVDKLERSFAERVVTAGKDDHLVVDPVLANPLYGIFGELGQEAGVEHRVDEQRFFRLLSGE